MSDDVRVGIAQWTPDRDPDGNLRTAQAAIRELARRGCRLALLPELWLCGYRPASLAGRQRDERDGPVVDRGIGHHGAAVLPARHPLHHAAGGRIPGTRAHLRYRGELLRFKG